MFKFSAKNITLNWVVENGRISLSANILSLAAYERARRARRLPLEGELAPQVTERGTWLSCELVSPSHPRGKPLRELPLEGEPQKGAFGAGSSFDRGSPQNEKSTSLEVLRSVVTRGRIELPFQP